MSRGMSALSHRPQGQNRASITLVELDEIESGPAFRSREDHLVQPPKKRDTAGFYQCVPSAVSSQPLLNTAGHFRTFQVEVHESMRVTAGPCQRYPSASFGVERQILDTHVERALNAAKCFAAAPRAMQMDTAALGQSTQVHRGRVGRAPYTK